MPKVKDSKFMLKRKGPNKVLDSPDYINEIQDELIETIELEDHRPNDEQPLPYEDKDQESDEFNTANIGNETSKIMKTFASDMNKAFSAKKRDVEMFTDSIIKINESYVKRILNSSTKDGNLLEDFCPKIIEVVEQIGVELARQKEREEKLQKLFQHQIKVMEQQRVSNLRKLGHLKELYDTFFKEIERRKSKHDEEVDSAMQEMKQEIMLMQKRKLMEIQQQEMKNMRRSLQTLLYS